MQTAEQQRLDKATRAALRAQSLVGRIELEAQGIAALAAEQAGGALVEVLTELRALGASELQPVPDSSIEIPFHALTPPELFELENLLEQARALADRVDSRRGRAHADGEGYDWGELIGQMQARASLELHGPSGSVTGARE